MCGSEGKLFEAYIEGAELNVCENCSKLGKIRGVVQDKESIEEISKITKLNPSQPETVRIISEDYSQKVKDKRENLKLTQKEFANKLNEKVSIIQKIESGNFEPTTDLLKKIQRFLNINLIEEYEEKHEKQSKSKTGSFTIGDFIKIKDK